MGLTPGLAEGLIPVPSSSAMGIEGVKFDEDGIANKSRPDLGAGNSTALCCRLACAPSLCSAASRSMILGLASTTLRSGSAVGSSAIALMPATLSMMLYVDGRQTEPAIAGLVIAGVMGEMSTSSFAFMEAV